VGDKSTNEMGGVGYVAHMRNRRGAYRVFGGRHDGKRLLERPGHRWGIILNGSSRSGMGVHRLDCSGSG
jgi:hypothetical protein